MAAEKEMMKKCPVSPSEGCLWKKGKKKKRKKKRKREKDLELRSFVEHVIRGVFLALYITVVIITLFLDHGRVRLAVFPEPFCDLGV